MYSYAVESPSVSPSSFPSISPSISMRPSSTSAAPSSNPSSSSAPSSSPTQRPTTLSPTKDPFKQARIEITIPGKFSLSGFNMPSSTVEMARTVTILADNIRAAMSTNLNSSQRIAGVRILSINGVSVTGGFSLRRLESRELSVATVEYETLLEEICSNSDCSNADAVAEALYEQATDAMRDEIDSGAFASSVQAAASAENLNTLLSAAVQSNDFGAVVLALLGTIQTLIYYPDWENGSVGYCANDGASLFHFILRLQLQRIKV